MMAKAEGVWDKPVAVRGASNNAHLVYIGVQESRVHYGRCLESRVVAQKVSL